MEGLSRIEWKHRYTAFLAKAEPASDKSVKAVETDPQYQQLEQAYKQADAAAKSRRDDLQKQITNLSAQILAVQNIFTDKRAYANALTYQIETETSSSGKQSKRKELEEYKKKLWTVEFPDGHKEKYDFRQLEEKYNELKDERTKLNAELGDVLKPVTAASTAMSAYVADHMVDLTPTQIEGLQREDERVGSEDRADQRGGRQYRRPLRVLPHGHSRAAENHARGHDSEG